MSNGTSERKPSLELLQTILDLVPLQIVVRDSNSVIRFANSAFCAVYGCNATEVIGRRDADYWVANGRPPEQIDQWLGEDREILATGIGRDYLQEITRANGEVAYFHNSKQRITMPDGAQCILVIYNEVTENKRVEKELHTALAREAELAGIQKTTATYAHEVNNPLTGILGMVQILLEDHPGQAGIAEMLEEIQAAARRIKDVIRKMETLSHPLTRPYLDHSELIDLRDEG